MTTTTESMPGRPRPRLLGAAAAAILAAAAVVAVVLIVGSGSGSGQGSAPSATAHHEAKYGGIPKWLPKTESTGERVVSASAAKPALAIQGNTVAVHFGHGKVLATAVGPEVPEEGEFPVPATSPCTFVVTFARSSAPVPVDPADFSVIDEEGHLHHPKLMAMDGGAPPSTVPAGKTESIKVHGVFPTGDGGLRWAPGGGTPAVTWDFDVEID